MSSVKSVKTAVYTAPRASTAAPKKPRANASSTSTRRAFAPPAAGFSTTTRAALKEKATPAALKKALANSQKFHANLAKVNAVRVFDVPAGMSLNDALTLALKATANDPQSIASKLKAQGRFSPEAQVAELLKNELISTGVVKNPSDPFDDGPRVDTNRFGFADFIKAERIDDPKGTLWSAETKANHNGALDGVSSGISKLFPRGFREFGINTVSDSKAAPGMGVITQMTSVLVDPQTRRIVVMNRDAGI